ncbi:hypothetical protein BR93DRAFT_925674 [Coniochaeta sp. PMI_546]|nr:hypothetical protein BR93DRAFT_925674 [Coniochaeta sp. PMI_546]
MIRPTYIITTLISFTCSVVNASTINKRVPILGTFEISTDYGCPITYGTNSRLVTVNFGDACGNCFPVTPYGDPNGTYQTVSNLAIDPRCMVTLFQTNNCQDPGIVTGPACWTPDAGIRGYSVVCPSYHGSRNWVRPCYSDPLYDD